MDIKKVIITGGKGFIGTRLVSKLKSLNIETIIIDLKDGNDIRTIIKSIKDIDVIFHLAAKVSVPKSFKKPSIYYSTNVYGTANLLKLYPNTRFINISSSSAKTCYSPYAISKYLSEKLGYLHNNCVNLRLFNVFGDSKGRNETLIPYIANNMLKNKTIKIYGDGKQLRDFTYIEDTINNIIWYAKNNIKGTFDIGYGKPKKVIEIFNFMKEYFNYNKNPIYLPERKGDILINCAKDKLHIKPIGFEKGLIITCNWWKNNGY